MDDGIFVLMTSGFKHHFYINRKHFILQANQGKPFVIFNNKLYYTTELNLADYNLQKADFIEIDLNSYLK